MESVFTVLLLILVLLFYVSNKDNKVNRWCAVAGFIFWLGIAKESFMYNIVPYLDNAWNYTIPYDNYVGAYSVMTWALYSLAMPTAVVFSMLFGGVDGKKLTSAGKLKALIYLPGLLLSFIFHPWRFHEYQLSSLPFWITYSVYNLCFVIAYACFMIAGVRNEKHGRAKTQKRLVGMVVLPPILYWYITVFPTHTLQLHNLLKLWQGNVFILFICIVVYIFMAFKEGFMGLRLTGETYQWNSDMDIISKGAEYTSHMLKNQTSKMELCIEQLKLQLASNGHEEPPEELAILSRSINTLKNYVDKIKRHSQNIHLLEEPYRLMELLADAMPFSLSVNTEITVHIGIPENVFWVCDKGHMTELFSNIITNAVEAIRESGTIEISGAYEKNFYLLNISDTGVGMDDDTLKKIFIPYFTTKSTEKNFGLGLAYCKNVITKHGGHISVNSAPGKGTTILIAIPSKRVAASGMEARDQDA